jgi:hypothetical protein
METEADATEFEFVEIDLPRDTDEDLGVLMAPHPCN